MKIEKFHIYLADLKPRFGTEPGKIRPVIVVQTDLLNEAHASTIVCPITTRITRESKLLRVYVPKKHSGLDYDSDILVDQIRAIDNRRFVKRVGKPAASECVRLLENLKTIILE